MDTQTQIERLIDLAIIQRSELKKLVSELPQLREHLNAEIERVFEDAEPQLRTELEDWATKQAKDQTTKLGGELEAKIAALSKSLEATTQTRYNAIMAERAQNIDLAKKAEDKLAEVAQAIPVQVKQIVTDELARFPRAGEIDQLRKEFAEPRGLNPRGRWQAGETYNKLDLVSYNGDSYVSSTDGNREKPSRSSEAWTLSAARGNGGTGGGVTSLTDLVAVPSNGQLLIGNGSAFVNNTITAGTGVTVTNGPGTITIDASGAQEILTATVTNAESVAITRGQVVYLFGATGNRASVKLANNATDAESSKTFGVVSEASIAAGANGLVTCVGTVDKLALGSYTEGDVLYLGATPGSVTATKPYAPNHLVYVGIVERANNGNGELYVRIQNGFELDEIHDVQITTPPLAGSLLMRDATTSLWKANRLTGTANQVTVTNADTSVTLSLPTAIANVNSVTAATTQNLTLAGGSTGASLVLGQGTSRSTLTGGNQITDGYGQLNVFTNTVQAADIGGSIGLGGVTGSGVNPYVFAKIFGRSEAASGYAGYMGFATTLVTTGEVRERMRLTSTGNLLIGTTTDGGQKLQVAGDLRVNHTGSAVIDINSTAAAGSATRFLNSGTVFGYLGSGKYVISNSYDIASIALSTSGAQSLYLGTNGTTALTLASNQAATFAGAVTVNAISGINALAAGTQLATFESSVNGAAVELITKGKNSTGTARQANIGINRFADDVLSFSNGTTESLRLHLTTQAATFAGAVTVASGLNNTLSVGASSPANPNPYTTLNGLRISGGDTGNTIYNGSRAIGITSDTGTSIFIGRSNGTTGMSVDTTTGAATFAGAVTGSSFEFNVTGAARLKPNDGYVYFQVGGSPYFNFYPNAAYSEIATNNATYKHIRFVPTSNGSVVVNNAAVATTATSGFLYVPTCAGAPTGVPASHTGTAPIVIDTTNNKLYFYSGGAWRDAGP